MKIKTLSILYMLILSTSVMSTHASQTAEIEERIDDSPIHNVSSEDEAMNAAMYKARNTVDLLISNFKEIKEKGYPISVKVNLYDDTYSEHFWLSDIEFKGGVFEGRIDNNPMHLRQYKLGQFVTVKPDKISDWFLIVDQKIYGAHTMQVARSRMNQKQRENFDLNFPYLKILEQNISK